MKATFKRDYSYWPAWLPITVYFLAVIGLFIVMGIGGDNYYLLMMPVAFVFYFVAMIRNPFHITDDNKLTGNGFIDVELINRLERKHKGVSVYYRWPNGKAEQKRFFPLKDIDTFISTLLEINPNIKLN